MEGILDTLSGLWYLPQAWFFYKSMRSFIAARENRACRIIGAAIGLIVCTMVIFPRDVFNITMNIPLFFLMLFIGFKQKNFVKLSLLLLFFPIIISVNFLSQEFAGLIWQTLAPDSRVMNSFISNLFLGIPVMFWYFFNRFSDDRFREMTDTLDTKSWLLLDLICLASLAAVISCIYYTPRESYKIWLCMLACLITNLASIRLVAYFAENIRGKLLQRNMRLQQDYYRELESNQTEIRKFRHDMNNHFSVVYSLLEEGKEEEAKAYFQKLSGQLRAKGRTFCKNSIVNAVLNSKYNRAEEAGIDCFFHIEIDQLLFIDNVDLCTIFSNTLDNAIEANISVPKEKRRISVRARCTENGYFSYEIENSKNQEIKLEEGRYKTWKKDVKSHGIGIENVKDVVERYKGTMDITYDDEKFCVVILIAEDGSLADSTNGRLHFI